jgi:hypothetical protein
MEEPAARWSCRGCTTLASVGAPLWSKASSADAPTSSTLRGPTPCQQRSTPRCGARAVQRTPAAGSTCSRRGLADRPAWQAALSAVSQDPMHQLPQSDRQGPSTSVRQGERHPAPQSDREGCTSTSVRQGGAPSRTSVTQAGPHQHISQTGRGPSCASVRLAGPHQHLSQTGGPFPARLSDRDGPHPAPRSDRQGPI